MTIRDVCDICKIFALTLVAWLLPPRFWRKAANAIRTIGRTDSGWPAYRLILAHKYSEHEITNISIKRRIYSRERQLQILGLNGPWHSWCPDICLNGAVHLRKALEAGHGAILWLTDTAWSPLIAQIALHNAGYPASHLSRPGHGFSTSSFGIRFLNPIWTQVEDRFIAERVSIKEEYATNAVAVLRERLTENRVVSIMVGWQAHKFAEASFFCTKLKLPTGPIQLARTTGAVLFPVFAVAKDNGGFEVSIQNPLLNPTGGHADDDATVAAAYAKRLERFVSEYPDQWNGWYWLMSRVRLE